MLNKPVIAVCTIMLFAAGIVSAGRPALVRQTICYDRDEATGVCGQAFVITIPADEARGKLHRGDSLRQLRAADMAYESITGRVVDVPQECSLGDPSCVGCYTPFHVVGGLTACDGACTTCSVRKSKARP